MLSDEFAVGLLTRVRSSLPASTINALATDASSAEEARDRWCCTVCDDLYVM